MDKIQQTDGTAKQKQAYHYNRRNGVQSLPPLSPGDSVLTKLDGQKRWSTPAVVQGTSSTPRSYILETALGERYRRNRRHLLATPNHLTSDNRDIDVTTPAEDVDFAMPKETETPVSVTHETLLQGSTVTCSGRVSKPAAKLSL